VWPFTDRANTALSAIILNDEPQIVGAAEILDDALTRLIPRARDA